MNELLFFGFLIIYFTTALVVYRFWRREGVLLVFVLSIIVCNLQVVKQVTLFGLQATLGNIAYGMTFWTTDLLSEMHGKKESRRAVVFGFIALVLFTFSMRYALWYRPGPEDWAQGPLTAIFAFLPRVVLASYAAYLVSQFHDIWLFHLLRDWTRGRHLWLRNNIATILSQLWDTLIFVSIAFIGVFSWGVLFQIYLTTWLFKVLVALLDTPFIYLATRWKWIAADAEPLANKPAS